MSIKHFLSFLLLTNIGIIHTQDQPQTSDVHNEVSEWIDQHVSHMTPEQVQLTANFAYLLYTCALLECTVRTRIPAITATITLFTQKLRSNQDTIYELAIAKALIANLKKTAYGRQLMYKTLEQADLYLDTNKHDEKIQHVVIALESLGTRGRQHILHSGAGKDLCAAYYQAIYQYMQTHNIAQYQFLMFCPKGIIAPEFRTKVLDDPKELADNVSKLAMLSTNNNVTHKERTIHA